MKKRMVWMIQTAAPSEDKKVREHLYLDVTDAEVAQIRAGKKPLADGARLVRVASYK